MKTFACSCEEDATLFFDSVSCIRCGRMAGFCPDRLELSTFDPAEPPNLWEATGREPGLYRQCDNYFSQQVCNWMIPAEDPNAFCRACRLNAVIPDLSQPGHKNYWARLEAAKRRALFTLLELGLPVVGRQEDPQMGLQFRFMTDSDSGSEFTRPLPGQMPIYTGHNQGEITINLAEADAVAQTRARIAMRENYRTLLGHFRHELGHYFWHLFIASDGQRQEEFRALFGDDREDYRQALERYYGNGTGGAHPDFITAYAAAHPWEDWAETCAHFLHMIDTLETAGTFGVHLHGRELPSTTLPQSLRGDGGGTIDANALISDWMRLAVGMNALNRSMGLPDAYPFVLTDTVQRKLQYVLWVVLAECGTAGELETAQG